jgi:hypothetical protein
MHASNSRLVASRGACQKHLKYYSTKVALCGDKDKVACNHTLSFGVNLHTMSVAPSPLGRHGVKPRSLVELGMFRSTTVECKLRPRGVNAIVASNKAPASVSGRLQSNIMLSISRGRFQSPSSDGVTELTCQLDCSSDRKWIDSENAIRMPAAPLNALQVGPPLGAQVHIQRCL